MKDSKKNPPLRCFRSVLSRVSPVSGLSRLRSFILFLSLAILALAAPAGGADFDSQLFAKATGYQTYLEEWHAAPLGGLTGGVYYTDTTRQEIACLYHQGDSTIWTGMYLGSQALRYRITGDAGARAEVLRVARYLHDIMDITDTPGYVARFADVDEAPWNCGYSDDHGWKNQGVGPWEGYYWIDHTSRDQYSGWWFGLSLAYDMVDDEAMRATIRRDFAAVVEMLVNNQWNITDQNGEWTGNNAAWVGPMMRLSWLVQAAHVIDEDYYWDLLDEQYRANKATLWIDSWAFFNRYDEYYGNNLRHLAYYSLFRLWPDRRRLEEIWDIWLSANRPHVQGTLNPWFDAVHATGCLRLGLCDSGEMDAIREDTESTLSLYWEPPAYKRTVTCSEDLPPDEFSIWMDQFLNDNPWLRDLINVRPQRAVARDLDDRHWTDMYWQSTPFEWSCQSTEDQTYTGPGFDYILAFWIGVNYGLLPGDGPYGDGDLDDDSADDDDDEDDDSGDGDDDEDDDGDDGDDDDTSADPGQDDDDDPSTPSTSSGQASSGQADDGGCCG